MTKSHCDEGLLHYACRYGRIDIIKLLIEKCGCDPHVVTKNNQNMLHYACRCGNIDVVKYLIDNLKQLPEPIIEGQYQPIRTS